MQIRRHKRLAAAALAVTGIAVGTAVAAAPGSGAAAQTVPDRSAATTTPIKHLVVLFDENVSFDHYFATYPHAANTDGTTFTPKPGTPKVNNLATAHLLKQNPNSMLPHRLTPDQALTCDQNHGYNAEQKAFDGGKMDAFPENVSVDTCSGLYGSPGLTMDYFDGNTVTAMWNYAQQYSLADNFWGSTFGPSSPGAINLISGNTHGISAVTPVTHQPTTDSYTVADPNAKGIGTMINDPDPAYDDCSDKNHTSTNNLGVMHGRNIGDLLTAKGVSWGWFQGGFAPTTAYAGSGTFAVCGASHTNIGGTSVVDYSPHHNPFEYYASTANEHHLPPANLAEVGHAGQANHQYDLSWFDTAASAGKLPAVSFVKAGEYQDGHAGYSDPIDEQNFLVHEINLLQQSPQWSSTAVVIAYDDSDGWYDHAAPAIRNSSHSATNDAAICTDSSAPTLLGFQDRCGPGPRLPMLVISPYAKTNFVDRQYTEQASIIKFVESNWSTGRIGNGSFDARAGQLNGMFDFASPNGKQVLLRPDGAVRSIRPITTH